ncbi:MAG: RrF2 family transcriptional regulator [Bacteroidota bacterium]
MLSKKAKYGLKALEYIAKQDQSRPIHTSEISLAESIPRKFLEAILLDLKHDGILKSKQGKNGGYLLLLEPEEVTIGRVVRLFDGPIALLPCVSSNYYEPCDDCENEAICGLKNIFAEVREATGSILDKLNLNDVLMREQLLKRKNSRSAKKITHRNKHK